MPVSDYDSNGFFGHDDFVDDMILRALDPSAQRRNFLIEGPANRGKSWALCRIREKLQSPVLLQSIVASQQPVATYLLTRDDTVPFDPLHLVACIWWALHPYLSNLFWPQGLPDNADKNQAIPLLYNFFTSNNLEAERLIYNVAQELGTAKPSVIFVLLVDGLDEFDPLDPVEREFVALLFRSNNVRVIGSRRSEVVTASWKTYSLRLQKQDLFILPLLDPQDAVRQIDWYLQNRGSNLSFADLQKKLSRYAWQNPGANRHLAYYASLKAPGSPSDLITDGDVRQCLLELSKSSRFPDTISDQDFHWLTTIVRQFPTIGTSEVPTHHLNQELETVAQRAIEDWERNAWLGRLQERGIVVRAKSGQCRVHPEFAALCQEWEAQRTP